MENQKKKSKVVSFILNALLFITVTIAGLAVGQYLPAAKTYITDLTLKEDNLAISEKFDNQIVLYGSDSCPFCRKGKTLLNELNVKWVYRNIDDDATANEEYSQLNEKDIPILIVGNSRYRGFVKEDWVDLVQPE